MTQSSDITRFVFSKALTDYFHNDKAEMAQAIGCPEYDLERALSAESIRVRAEIFEALVKYCMEHGLSIDALLHAYSEHDISSSAPSQPGKAD